MIKKNKALVCMLLMTAAFFMGYIYAVSKKPNDGFFCTSEVNFHTNNKQLSAAINFHMQDGLGFLTISGDYFENAIKLSAISLQKQFNYTERNGEYLLTQNNHGVLEVSEADKNILKEFFPDFYLTRDVKSHHVRIKKLRSELWIFTTAPVPYFVCTDY